MSFLPSLKSVMTPFPYAVESGAPLERARQLMDEHGVHHLPVVAGQQIVGEISHGDVVAALAREPDGGNSVEHVCVGDAYVVDLNEPIENVLLTMADRHIGSAIVTRHGKLAGVFTWVDACRAFGEFIRERYPRGGGNDAA